MMRLAQRSIPPVSRLCRSYSLPRPPLRCFHSARVLSKDEKSKQMLKNLGINLQKGNINESNDENGTNNDSNNKNNSKNSSSSSSSSSKDGVDDDVHGVADEQQIPEPSISTEQQMIQEQDLNDCFDSLSRMSTRDLVFQIGLDGKGQPFMSFANPHWVDSRMILRSVPDTLDLFDKSNMDQVEEIYEKLSQLDSNPQMHQKYLKRFFYDSHNDLMLLGQTLRGISSKFKQLRRNELDKFVPESASYEYISDKMKHPYNVVGFDRSLTGMPLRRLENVEAGVYPREFIQDLPAFDNKIQLKKLDLNFPEIDSSINIDPAIATPLKDLYDYENKNFNPRSGKDNIGGGIWANSNDVAQQQMHKAVHESLSTKMGLPRNYIPVENCAKYRRLKLNNHQITNRIEQEIRIMKKLLTDEIKTTIESSNAMLLSTNENYHRDHIKSNQFILCEIKNLVSGTFYIWKSFSILPVYFLLPLTKRREKLLANHLCKLFLINLEDKINILFRIKYDHARDEQKFMKTLLKNIGHTIRFRLWRYFKINKRSISTRATSFSSNIQLPLVKSNLRKKQAVVYAPYTDSCYKRIYWIRKRKNAARANKSSKRVVPRKGAERVDFAVIGEELLE
ncbi:uncharacterized protein LODBEIA_P56430 [Lodderomyces beijingensis]|uniref:Uncharacterized protein n=1 Tax=Lodderomyces beijingensis TaxID=1775926 RepID=A0ABP0ZU49_9ASCO